MKKMNTVSDTRGTTLTNQHKHYIRPRRKGEKGAKKKKKIRRICENSPNLLKTLISNSNLNKFQVGKTPRSKPSSTILHMSKDRAVERLMTAEREN
jgi:hypothetical protein